MLDDQVRACMRQDERIETDRRMAKALSICKRKMRYDKIDGDHGQRRTRYEVLEIIDRATKGKRFGKKEEEKKHTNRKHRKCECNPRHVKI